VSSAGVASSKARAIHPARRRTLHLSSVRSACRLRATARRAHAHRRRGRSRARRRRLGPRSSAPARSRAERMPPAAGEATAAWASSREALAAGGWGEAPGAGSGMGVGNGSESWRALARSRQSRKSRRQGDGESLAVGLASRSARPSPAHHSASRSSSRRWMVSGWRGNRSGCSSSKSTGSRSPGDRMMARCRSSMPRWERMVRSEGGASPNRVRHARQIPEGPSLATAPGTYQGRRGRPLAGHRSSSRSRSSLARRSRTSRLREMASTRSASLRLREASRSRGPRCCRRGAGELIGAPRFLPQPHRPARMRPTGRGAFQGHAPYVALAPRGPSRGAASSSAAGRELASTRSGFFPRTALASAR